MFARSVAHVPKEICLKIFDVAFAIEESVLGAIIVRGRLEHRATGRLRAWDEESCIINFLLLSSVIQICLLSASELGVFR